MPTQQKIKILYILEASTGGTFRHVSDILSNLNQEKFDISLIISTLRDSSIKKELAIFEGHGIKVHKVAMQRSISLKSDFRAFKAIRCIIKKEKFDIIHTHSSKAGILGRFAALFTEAKRIHTPHVFPFEMKNISFLKKTLYLLLEIIAGHLTHKLIAVCQHEKLTALKYKVIPRSNIAVIYNGITPKAWQGNGNLRQQFRDKYNIPPEKTAIGILGRFVPQKGHSTLVNAIKQLPADERNNIILILIGNGPLKNDIHQQISDAELEKNTIFIPYQKDLKPYYNMLDIVVIPSNWEALPYTLLEAMAMKKVVIASFSGGMPELIEQNTSGLLVKTGSSTDLKDGILKAITSSHSHQMGQCAREKAVSTYTLQNMVNNLEKTYNQLITSNS